MFLIHRKCRLADLAVLMSHLKKKKSSLAVLRKKKEGKKKKKDSVKVKRVDVELGSPFFLVLQDAN